jgi:hypothetical protein
MGGAGALPNKVLVVDDLEAGPAAGYWHLALQALFVAFFAQVS